MDAGNLLIREAKDTVTFKVKVQPRASRSQIAGIIGDALKLQLTSPPVDGAANAACIEYLAKVLGVAKNRVVIVAGEKSRDKTIQVLGMSKNEFIAKITNIVNLFD